MVVIKKEHIERNGSSCFRKSGLLAKTPKYYVSSSCMDQHLRCNFMFCKGIMIK